jgi:hypothetical protein
MPTDEQQIRDLIATWMSATRAGDITKLAVFVGILAYVGNMARRGLLPRTRPIVPGELAVSD